ncbi:hypothetical protein TNCV_2532691 [Trichonephila clavipes]|nr:hypothetical protein TNCV_2532691 [Trichonephila clavipes]
MRNGRHSTSLPGAAKPLAPAQPRHVPSFQVSFRSRNYFLQDNARPHVSVFVRTFIDTENVRLLASIFTRSLSNRKRPSMVAERLTCHHVPVTTFDELWQCVEAAWVSVHPMPSNLCLTQCLGV